MEFMTHGLEWAKHITTEQALWGLGILAAAAVIGYILWRVFRRPDAYIYVPEGMALAAWQYRQLPMKECAFCGRKVDLNRHHCIPFAADPSKYNDPNNLIVLCGGSHGCHLVVGHKQNYKKFNPYVAEICEKYGGPPLDSNEYYRQTHGGKDRTEVRK